MILMAMFYEYWRKEHMSPPQALRAAQQWLRDTTNDEKQALFEQAVPELSSHRMAADTAREAMWKLWEARYPPGERSFDHPFHWAAFGYTGV